jgi:hypothetical protein
MCTTIIIQLDRSNIKFMGEMKDVMILLASNPQVYQIIDIVVVGIPKAYSLLLSTD